MRHPASSPRVLLKILLLCLCFAKSPLFGQATSASIIGQVRISPGNMLPHPILVNLEGRGMMVGQNYTDEEGHFAFNGLPGNVYHVVINEEGYLPIREQVVSDPETAPMRLLTIYLVPKKMEKPSESVVVGESPYLSNEADYGKIYPPKAVKEFLAGKKNDQNHKVKEAMKHYENAIALAPNFYAARNNLGTLYLSRSQYDEAQEQFERVIALNSSNASAYFNLANVHLLRGHTVEAQRCVEQGLKKQPYSAFGNFLAGSIYSQGSNKGKAEPALRRALEIDPTMAQAHLALVNLYVEQQRSPDAIAELKTFLRTFPNHPFASRARDVLKKLEGTPETAN